MTVVLPVGFGIATIKWLLTGQVRESTTTFAFDPPSIDPAVHASAIHGILTAAGGPCVAASMIQNWAYTGVHVTEQDESGPISAEQEAIVNGTIVAESPPNNFAVLITKQTLSGGRRNRGRMFVPPIRVSETGVDQTGRLTTTIRNQLQADWNVVRDNMITAGLPWVLLHSEVPFTPTPITAITVSSLGATQRRRMRR